jgi:hypothetical protein
VDLGETDSGEETEEEEEETEEEEEEEEEQGRPRGGAVHVDSP